MAEYDIWMEGYAVTGNSAGASYVGHARGSTFEEACKNYAEAHPRWAKGYYDPERNTYWGCKLYTNEGKARKHFG